MDVRLMCGIEEWAVFNLSGYNSPQLCCEEFHCAYSPKCRQVDMQV